MLKHRIIEILSTFSRNDIKRFREYLCSPFFNKSKKLLTLFETLITFYPDFSSANFTAEKIFKKVNPGLPFNNSTFRNLLFDLSNAADNYMSVKCFSEREFEKMDCLREEQFKRNLSKQLLAGIIKAGLIIEDLKDSGSNYFLDKFRLTNDINNFYTLFKPKTGNEAITVLKDNLSEQGRNITAFYTNEIMKIFDNLNSMKKSFDIKEEENFVFKVFQTVDFEKLLYMLSESSGKDQESIKFRLSLACFLAFRNLDKVKYYFDYKKLIMRHIRNLRTDEIRSHTINLIRYCMIRSTGNKNDQNKFVKEKFNIYVLILQNKFYRTHVSEFIPIELFRSILIFSLDLKKYTWTYDFIKKYGPKLAPEKRENMFHFSSALYFFYRGKYEETMKHFQKIKYDHFLLKVDMKNLMLRTFYELEMYEQAFSLVDSYKHFLSNDKILSRNEKQLNKNFLNAVHKMLLYLTSDRKTGKYNIENALRLNFPHKDWALEKFDQLDKIKIRSA